MPIRLRRPLALVALLPIVLTGCVTHELSETKDQRTSIPAGKAELVRAEITMGAGKIDLSGGAKNLLDGDFRYNVPGAKPEVRYDDSSFRGTLVVRQTGSGVGIGNVVNEWNLRLSEQVPVDLYVKLGAGESHLDVSRLMLRGIEMHVGAGQVEVDLRGDYKKAFDVQIHGGVGEATVRLPSKVGVRATARGGIGGIDTRNLRKENDAWVNDAWDNAPVRISVDVRGGVGQINLYRE
jgi:hypothetical protein